MMLREIAYRKVNFLLGWAGISAAIAPLVGVMTCLQFHVARSDELVVHKQEQTQAIMAALESDLKKAMQRLGCNAIVLPKDQPLGDWYAEDYADHSMPASCLSPRSRSGVRYDKHSSPLASASESG
jgi:hypothetical protein